MLLISFAYSSMYPLTCVPYLRSLLMADAILLSYVVSLMVHGVYGVMVPHGAIGIVPSLCRMSIAYGCHMGPRLLYKSQTERRCTDENRTPVYWTKAKCCIHLATEACEDSLIIDLTVSWFSGDYCLVSFVLDSRTNP